MKILISGGLGFVGRNISKGLLKRDHEVVIVDALSEGSGARELKSLPQNEARLLSSAKILIDDIRNFDHEFFESFDVVLHLAAVVGGRLKIENQPLAIAEDLEIDGKVIREWGLGAIKHLIYASSSAAYPIRLQKAAGYKLKESDIDFEGDIGRPDLTYGWAKLTGEFLLHIGKSSRTGKVTVIRPFSGYGIDQDISYPFPSIFSRVMSYVPGSSPFYVWGTGLQERDFVYIDDVTSFLSVIAETSLEGTFNIATGIATNFQNLARQILEMSGVKNPIVSGKSEMPEGVFSRIGNNERYINTLRQLNMPPPRDLHTVITYEYPTWVNYYHSLGLK